ncbi:30S ribosomal protein S4 [Blastopirellula retiformator]|uniref:Small ribosomal subunit protein uS4 n=1 Tax=Blastopirellula retiformator TaxID=2527970 RepID=A0A5C5UZC4_9BACT|nr:30S ribosomal protein S4 [Blastopirellula retiformator]TWT30837.1 30S ribosomal protein S4 [Blastopirellula retiformator]
MGHYTGPKARINRRLGGVIYENRGAIKAYDRRATPPGMHNRPRRPSNYGAALMEKQKIKHYYGLGERQLRRYFEHAKHMKGNTGEQLLILCERRLDNFVRRAGLALTRPQARQGIVHGHFLVNGAKVDKPSYQLRPGDIVSVRNREKLQVMYRSILGENGSQIAAFASQDQETLSATFDSIPTAEDVSLPVDVNIVVEFMSR